MSDENAIREYVVRKVTLHVDNDQRLYWPVKEAAVEAVKYDMSSGWDRYAFLEMLAGRGQTDRREVAEVVGIAVCHFLAESLSGAGESVWLSILSDVLDLGDSEQRVLFGEHFMPEADDWPGDDEDDE